MSELEKIKEIVREFKAEGGYEFVAQTAPEAFLHQEIKQLLSDLAAVLDNPEPPPDSELIDRANAAIRRDVQRARDPKPAEPSAEPYTVDWDDQPRIKCPTCKGTGDSYDPHMPEIRACQTCAAQGWVHAAAQPSAWKDALIERLENDEGIEGNTDDPSEVWILLGRAVEIVREFSGSFSEGGE